MTLLRSARGAPQRVTAGGQERTGQPAIANDAQTRFLVGSVSKWITTVAVLRLMDQGRIDIDQPVTSWLPELPAASRAVTLRHLLSNTSGIPNGVAQALRTDRAAVEGATFTPGSRFDYSFTNRVIVGGIVERVTGEPFQQAIARLVLQPAGVREIGSGSAKRTVVWNSGVFGGYKTLLVYAPADGAAAVLMNNTDVEQAEQRKLAETLLENLLQAQ